jgi:hypothetical protein
MTKSNCFPSFPSSSSPTRAEDESCSLFSLATPVLLGRMAEGVLGAGMACAKEEMALEPANLGANMMKREKGEEGVGENWEGVGTVESS